MASVEGTRSRCLFSRHNWQELLLLLLRLLLCMFIFLALAQYILESIACFLIRVRQATLALFLLLLYPRISHSAIFLRNPQRKMNIETAYLTLMMMMMTLNVCVVRILHSLLLVLRLNVSQGECHGMFSNCGPGRREHLPGIRPLGHRA